MDGTSMKQFYRFLPLVLLIVSVVQLPAQQLSGRFSTSFYSWERFTSDSTSDVITRAYQNIQLDGAYNKLSFHTTLTGSMGSASSLSSEAQVRVYGAYLQWKRIADVADLNVGRIPIFAGVGNGIVDGISVKFHGWDEKVIATGYGGMNVGPALASRGFDDFDKNFLVGGQVIGYLFDGSRIGLSYMNRNRSLSSYRTNRLDSLFNPVSMIICPDVRKEQLLGFDASYAYKDYGSVYGRCDYEINTQAVLRGEASIRANSTSQLAVTGEYIYRAPRVPYHSFFSVFEFEALNELCGGIEYSICPSMAAFGRVAFVQYDEELSRRLTIGVNSTYGSIQYSGSNGYSGQLASFSVEGMYPLFEKKLIPTIGASFATYRLDRINDTRQEIYSGSLGAVVRLLSSFSFDAQVQWARNKIAENDVRAFGKISYWFSHVFSKPQQTGGGQ